MRSGGRGGFPSARAGTICDSLHPRCFGCTATGWTRSSSAAAKRGTIVMVGRTRRSSAFHLTSRLHCSPCLQRGLETPDQGRGGEGLGQKAGGSRLHRPLTEVLIGEGCDENEWCIVTLGAHRCRQVQAAHA